MPQKYIGRLLMGYVFSILFILSVHPTAAGRRVPSRRRDLTEIPLKGWNKQGSRPYVPRAFISNEIIIRNISSGYIQSFQAF